MRQNLFSLVLFASMLPIGAAQGQVTMQSQEGIALENQILQLQQQVQQLQAGAGGGGSALGGAAPSSNSGGGTPPPDASVVTNLLNQVGQLQTQVQQLSGRVDTLQNQVTQQNAATTKAIGDINFKLGNGPAAPGGTPPVAGAPTALIPPTTAPATPPVAPTVPAAAAASPKNLLKEAQAAYAKHDYSTAETDARALVAKGGPQAYTGQYLLAESLAAEGRHQDAAIAYDDAYNKNREGVNAAASLLGLANSLTDINQAQAACDTLSSLNSQFPTPPAGLGPKITAASHRAHCS